MRDTSGKTYIHRIEIADKMDSERDELEQLIKDWNESRLDIFTISKPDDNLDFFGVMRFYFQEPGAKDRKVATKCIRVNSSDTTEDVMKVLVSKFHPDLKMLTMPNYSLYEVHETGTVCKLEPDQKPLYVQLYWQQSDRDGRFLLKSEDEQMTTQSLFETHESDADPNLERRLSRREKKQLRKQRREDAKKAAESKDIAKELYGDRPASGLTRSLSNPEVVMKLRRKKRLEERLEQFKNEDNRGSAGGGPMRIFAESLKPETPYKTVLVSAVDTTDVVLKTALEKYEVPPEEMDLYCLTMVTIPPGNQSDPETSGVKERIVDDKDCPLAIASSWPEGKGELRFYLKKKDNMPKRVKRGPPKRRDDTRVHYSPASSPHSPKETTFDVEEKAVPEKQPISPLVHVVDSAHDLPATLEFRESGEDAFFAFVVSEVNGSAVHFKLAPTYTLYMCCRYRLSLKFRPDFTPIKRQEKVAMTAKTVANKMWQTVKENHTMAGHLAFWMANSSELLHFLKQDRDLSAITEESQKILAHTTQQAFRSLVSCIKAELQGCLPAFLDPSDDGNYDEGEMDAGDEKIDPSEGYHSTERSFRVKHYGPHGQPLGGDQWMGKRKKALRPVLGDVLHTLSSAMSLFRRCRVNAALTIQLFSQLFHYINMWIFNRLVLEPQLKLCTRAWGIRLLERLGRIQDWAENLGLELAAECHLGRVTQAAFLLQVPKQDSTAISSHCYKLNSLQLRQLLEFYEPERDEPPISQQLIDKAVAVAESTADSVARSEGQEVLLQEEPDLHLPFLLPEDGYSSEQIRGVLPGLREFLEPLITPGLCRLTIQPKATGLWTVHFKNQAGPESPPPELLPVKEREVTKIIINKGSRGMGVSIVAAKGVGQEHIGIYVKEIVEGGPADLDGRLKAGDQILDVNGESLVGVQQEDAVKFLIKAGSVVNMTVAKRAVWQHGLSALLNKTAAVNKAETPPRSPDNQNPYPISRSPDNSYPAPRSPDNQNPYSSPRIQKKDVPRAPPRYRPPQDTAQRSPPVQIRNVHVETEQAKPPPPKPEPQPRQKRMNPYDSQYNEWKDQVRNTGEPEQTNIQTKTVVEYKLDDVPIGRAKYKAPVPYASQQEIQRRQKEMQERKLEEQRREQERENMERERMERERERMEREKEEREEMERKERERIKREDLARRERERKEREERERIQREELEQQERRERERIAREEQERKKREEWEKRERERIQREEREREIREREEKAEMERRRNEERRDLEGMARRARELEMMLEKERREKEQRLQELERQLLEQRAETERMEREYRERMRKDREERLEQPRNIRPPPVNTQVHYISEKEKSREVEENKREMVRPSDDGIPTYPGNYGKRPPLQNLGQESFEMDPVEIERQFQQRLAQESVTDEPDANFVTVIRVPVQSDNWEPRDGVGGKNRDMRGRPEHDVDNRPRVRVDVQRSEEERKRNEMQWKREQEFHQQRAMEVEAYRQQPVGSGGEPMYPRQPDWETEEERRIREEREEREENDRLREANANRLRNRIIENVEEEEEDGRSYTNGRTRRVKFASVRTEITQPSPETELSRAGVKFVHDGKVEDSDDDEEFPEPPPALLDDEPPPVPPPPEDDGDFYRPPPPPKPQYLINNNMNGAPPEYPSYRDSESMTGAQPHARMSEEEMRYATYPGRQPQNNNYPVPKPRVRNADFTKSPSPDQAKLPFKDKMKMFNENTPPKKQTNSKWERQWVNGDPL